MLPTLERIVVALVVAWPAIVELVCRGSRSHGDAIARAVIGSSASHVVLAVVVGAFGATSRPTALAISVAIAVGWTFVRRADIVRWVGEVGRDSSIARLFHGSKRDLSYRRVTRALASALMVIAPLAIALTVAGITLWQPHFSYDGMLARLNVIDRVTDYRITLPYFSDEWTIAAFTRDSIETGSLPILHPFDADRVFLNVLVPFLALVTHFFLIFDLDPIHTFAYAPLVNGVALVACLYFLARRIGATRTAAALASMTLPYVTNSANLAGIWYLIPLHAGLMAWVLASTLDDSSRVFRYIGYATALALYPPIGVFLVPVAIVAARSRRERLIGLMLVVGVALVCTVGAMLVTSMSAVQTLEQVWLLVTRPMGRDIGEGIPYYPPSVVIPIVALVGFLLFWKGAWARSRQLFVALALGAILWAAYMFADVSYVIDIQRVVFLTSFLVCAAAAIGYDRVMAAFASIVSRTGAVRATALLGATAIALVLVPSYTSDTSWTAFSVEAPANSMFSVYMPAPPANQYLRQDDLALFARYDADLSSAPVRFVSHPWKGLVIGAATRHVPLDTKSSIVATRELRYALFDRGDCATKTHLARAMNVDVVYGGAFTCPNFVSVGTSSESFVLYEFRDPLESR